MMKMNKNFILAHILLGISYQVSGFSDETGQPTSFGDDFLALM
jgi:hypothetical protein